MRLSAGVGFTFGGLVSGFAFGFLKCRLLQSQRNIGQLKKAAAVRRASGPVLPDTITVRSPERKTWSDPQFILRVSVLRFGFLLQHWSGVYSSSAMRPNPVTMVMRGLSSLRQAECA
jgi:hypothetical protein